MSLLHDLHCHSLASDGALAPADVVSRAAAAGVQVLALTDHDETAGLAEAVVAAGRSGLALVNGVEVSVSWRGVTLHIVGLGIDPHHAGLNAGLAQLREFRSWRAEEIARRLDKAGYPGSLAVARRHATGRIISRTHFARFLVEQGHAPEMRAVFRKFLTQGKPGYVPGEWATLEAALGWIQAAGGVAVIAHPGRYKVTATRLRELIEQFKGLGGAGIEVSSSSHSRDDLLRFAHLARHYGLYASIGSDFHAPDQPWAQLGRTVPLPDDLAPIWCHPLWRHAA